MTRRTIYSVVSWNDQRLRDWGRRPTTREYGSASGKQAAIRLAERVLPPDAEYIITTVHQTVHQGRTPVAESRIDQPQPQIRRTR